MRLIMKDKKTAFYASILSVVLGVIGLVFYMIGSIGGYYNDFNPLILIMLLLSLASLAYVAYKSNQLGNESPWRLLHIVASGLFMVTFMLMLNDRVFSFAILLGSDLEASNTAAYTRLYLSITAMVLILLAEISSLVSSFSKYK